MGINSSCMGPKKGWYTPNQSNPLQFPCNLLSRRRLRYFLFCEFFRADQGHLIFERLDLLVSVRLLSKSELCIAVASFRFIQ